MAMCCACGGGQRGIAPERNVATCDTHYSSNFDEYGKQIFGYGSRSCWDHDYNNLTCGIYVTPYFNSFTMCCSCGGGAASAGCGAGAAAYF